MPIKTYNGSCLCGAIKFEAGIDFDQDTGRCNCTSCWKLRLWYIRVQPENFRLLSGEDSITDYVHKSPSHQQLFCKTCGVHAFHKLNKPQLGEFVSVLITSLDDVDVEEVAGFKIKYQDGRNNSWWNEPSDSYKKLL